MLPILSTTFTGASSFPVLPSSRVRKAGIRWGLIILTVEVVSTSKTSVSFYQTARRNIVFILAAVRTWNITDIILTSNWVLLRNSKTLHYCSYFWLKVNKETTKSAATSEKKSNTRMRTPLDTAGSPTVLYHTHRRARVCTLRVMNRTYCSCQVSAGNGRADLLPQLAILNNHSKSVYTVMLYSRWLHICSGIITASKG
jgi:hypothetical protein